MGHFRERQRASLPIQREREDLSERLVLWNGERKDLSERLVLWNGEREDLSERWNGVRVSECVDHYDICPHHRYNMLR